MGLPSDDAAHPEHAAQLTPRCNHPASYPSGCRGLDRCGRRCALLPDRPAARYSDGLPRGLRPARQRDLARQAVPSTVNPVLRAVGGTARPVQGRGGCGNPAMTETAGDPACRLDVLVVVGTDYHPFPRLVRAMDEWSKEHPEVDCFVQYGTADAPVHASQSAY